VSPGPRRKARACHYAEWLPAFPSSVYVVELSLQTLPCLSVQRKELADASPLWRDQAALESGPSPKVLELSCEKPRRKQIGLLSSRMVAVQML